MLVVGGLLALIALSVIAGGAYGLWLHTTQRSDGYVMTSSERFATGSCALATWTLHLSSDVPGGFLYGRDWLGDLRIHGNSPPTARANAAGDVAFRLIGGRRHPTTEHFAAQYPAELEPNGTTRRAGTQGRHRASRAEGRQGRPRHDGRHPIPVVG